GAWQRGARRARSARAVVSGQGPRSAAAERRRPAAATRRVRGGAVGHRRRARVVARAPAGVRHRRCRRQFERGDDDGGRSALTTVSRTPPLAISPWPLAGTCLYGVNTSWTRSPAPCRVDPAAV